MRGVACDLRNSAIPKIQNIEIPRNFDENKLQLCEQLTNQRFGWNFNGKSVGLIRKLTSKSNPHMESPSSCRSFRVCI